MCTLRAYNALHTVLRRGCIITELIPDRIQFAENPEPRCPCVLVLDVSYSMSGEPIDQLNRGVATFARELKEDLLASLRTEVAIVAFAGGAEMAQSFISAYDFNPQRLDADEGELITEDQFYRQPLSIGDGTETLPPDYVTDDGLYCYKAPFRLLGGSNMSAGINLALDKIEERKQSYRENGIDYFRPWLFLITDGEPTEPQEVVDETARRLKDTESEKKVAAFSVGVEGANIDALARISPRRPLTLKGLEFGSMFVWLSHSLSQVSRSRTDDEIRLDQEGLRDWAAI